MMCCLIKNNSKFLKVFYRTAADYDAPPPSGLIPGKTAAYLKMSTIWNVDHFRRIVNNEIK